MIVEELLKASAPKSIGFLPVNKPKGICCRKLLHVMKLDACFVLRKNDLSPATVNISYLRHLETFANGLTTFIFGPRERLRKGFESVSTRYRAVIEFGVGRKGHCIDGQTTGRTTVEHLNGEIIEEAAKKFVGVTEQSSLNWPEISYGQASTFERIFQMIELDDPVEERKTPRKQKYPLARNKSDVVCQSIKLEGYHKPYAIINISCDSSFKVRRFTADLADSLNTTGNLVELTRMQEGPICLDDLRVVSIYNTNYEYYSPRLAGYQHMYRDYTLNPTKS